MPVTTHEPQANPTRRRVRRSEGPPVLLTLHEASAQFGIPYTSLYDLTRRGALPYVRFATFRRVWIKRVDLETLIERSTERGDVQ